MNWCIFFDKRAEPDKLLSATSQALRPNGLHPRGGTCVNVAVCQGVCY